MKLFWQKAEVQKFEHAKDFAEEYNIGKKDFILASKSTYEAYFAALGLEAHVEYKSKYGKGEPTDEMIDALLADFRKTDCDRIIAIGGGAVIDMAKILVLAGDYSAEEIFGRKVPLKRAKTLIAVPTTCGAGSEVSNVSIAEFTKLHTKMGLAVDEIYADRAVLIPELLTGLPYSFFATSAIDAFIHAIESYVSVMASDYTRGLSLQAIKLVFDYLEKSVKTPDMESREKMHNASTMAGMAFANAFLGICHSVAHKIGGEYGIPHGRTNAILLPHIIRYNAKDPQKHAMFPKYDFFRADTDYADIAKFLGLKGETTAELVEALATAVYELGKSVGIDMNLKAQGVTQEVLDATVDRMAELAYEDQCTTANPKEPLISELKQIIVDAYNG